MDQASKQALAQMQQQTTANSLPTTSHQQLPPTARKVIERYGDPAQFLLIFNPDLQTKVSANIERVYLGTAPSLNVVKLAYGIQVALSWLLIQLENLNQFAGVKNKLIAENNKYNPLLDLAQTICCSYGNLKVSELILFFHRFKAGRYGAFYGSVDPLKITTALEVFVRERISEMTKYEQIQQQIRLEKEHDERSKTAVTRQQYQQMKNKEQ